MTPKFRRLNREYRKKDNPDGCPLLPLRRERGGVQLLGDIVISLPTAGRQCASCGSSLRDEVRLLFCHGLLHLLGHDHRTKAEESAMIERQARYLGVKEEAAWRHDPAH
jgi:probable rRNA maturation factor